MNVMNWQAVAPEIVLLVLACAVTLVDLFVKDSRRRPTYWLTMLGLAAVAGLHLGYFNAGQAGYAMNRMLVSDQMGHLLAFFATVSVGVTLVYGQHYAASREILKGELFSLSLFSLLGISIMVAGNHLLVLYLGLEVMTLSLYAMVALRRDNLMATEAAMKYFVLGALSSGFLLYGLSMIYGATGSLSVPEIFQIVAAGEINKQVMAFGLVFIVAGLAFKLGAVPFHMWVPDVYHGAPTVATLLIASAPKLAAFGICMRLLVEGLLGSAVDWQMMLIALAIGSLVLGNLAAIAQTNIKRMLAYSTIAQIGFVLLGLSCGVVGATAQSTGYSAAMFYMVTYVFTTLGTFGMIMLLAREGYEADTLASFAGLNRRSPLLAALMAIFMFSLAGLPPAVGFYAKLVVLQALIATGDSLYLGLAIGAVLLSLVGAFYYLRVVKVMYFDEPQDAAPLPVGGDARALMVANGLAVLVFGLLPGGLMNWCAQAVLNAVST